MNENLRVVLDTNLVVSALIFGGKIGNLRLAWQNEVFIPLASQTTINELIRVLTYPKFKLTMTEQEALLSDYSLFCELVTIPEQLPLIPQCRDPFDQPFLVLAVVGKANYLVTGDKDILSLKNSFSCPILTVEQFFPLINRGGGPRPYKKNTEFLLTLPHSGESTLIDKGV